MKRHDAKEWLDEEGAVEPQELERSLREVWAVNRYLGGNPPLLRHLERLLDRAGKAGPAARPLRVLDVATGLADQPLAVHRWAAARGWRLRVTGVEISPAIAELARRRTAANADITIDVADGRRLPYADGSFDVAFSNLALHHLSDADAVAMLSELQRVARHGWVVTDLERHPLAYGAARLLALAVWRSPVTRHDGPLSVRRSYTADEALELLGRAGLNGAAVRRHFPWRLALLSDA
ncbi:methyltransferase domain-containing protein [Paenibacillus pasadenensis]|uniref:Methyltransferase type 11 n=1 Tax=Paenibacillus pasadenensis TaxID=217090 RepID=A0A2N5N600_9BACL|nr:MULTISPECIES: methyltransferase domain-containing protein [Paenibacillus]PLT45781.1 Methyltransferase type 11 [Paenibacillus pasadenensis]QGG56220.1 methyltransferase domain-containing protein [Paenibacillus sp. B01]